ncbi:hypothetical protein MAR_ORF007 [Marseillevirus marseillevirus]|uniref:Uncharacterized protein n=1 Tax=Marseillevirus marseillevirus TaxID=694581 RepID=D2XA23_GBMV|nr:hypothetical protein MAR_ORF007 [Marseillevirus marseillevirus]ADB03800.1 hypothetical protein MAR_ORF007 [Marseillevirus marseillevirus]
MLSILPQIKKKLFEEFGLKEEEICFSQRSVGSDVLETLAVPKYEVSACWYQNPGTVPQKLEKILSCMSGRILDSKLFIVEQRRNSAKVSSLELEVKELKELVERLAEKIVELEYAPGGEKAQEAKIHFEEFAQ